jgi:hypothetical protein
LLDRFAEDEAGRLSPIYVRVNVCMDGWMDVCVCVCVYVYTETHGHAFSLSHTHTHARTYKQTVVQVVQVAHQVPVQREGLSTPSHRTHMIFLSSML